MTDVVIKTETKEEKPIQDSDIKDTLKKADEYEKLKIQNDKLETEYLRAEELRAKITAGGTAVAGQKVEKSKEQLAADEAKEILSVFE